MVLNVDVQLDHTPSELLADGPCCVMAPKGVIGGVQLWYTLCLWEGNLQMVFKPVAPYKMFSATNEFFPVRFESGDDLDRILACAPYWFTLLVIKRWESKNGAKQDMLSSLSPWVHLRGTG